MAARFQFKPDLTLQSRNNYVFPGRFLITSHLNHGLGGLHKSWSVHRGLRNREVESSAKSIRITTSHPSQWPSEYVLPVSLRFWKLQRARLLRPRRRFARNGTPNLRSRKLTLTPSQRSAALKLDWTKLGTQLGLKGNTAAALQSFKKRNDDARRKVTVLSEQAQTVDFQHYRSILKNQSIIDDIEKQFTAFKPQTYDVGRQVKAIEAFEAQAIKSAEETKSVVDKELGDLEKTLKNIESARPFADLTVVRILQKRWRGRRMLTGFTGRGCGCSARH
jgi:F-type H+-transporting ATPase subunit d